MLHKPPTLPQCPAFPDALAALLPLPRDLSMCGLRASVFPRSLGAAEHDLFVTTWQLLSLQGHPLSSLKGGKKIG